jgi:hypothetical protein
LGDREMSADEYITNPWIRRHISVTTVVQQQTFPLPENLEEDQEGFASWVTFAGRPEDKHLSAEFNQGNSRRK